MSIGEIRRAQVITTYGPGALIPVDDESFMIAGIDSWFDQGNPDPSLEIRETRLESHLGVEYFVLPPSGDDKNSRDLPVVRFPLMYSCSSCHQLGLQYRISDQDGLCVNCGNRLVTSRFIAICDAGHVGEFPYMRWVHQGPEGPGEHRLTLRNEGRSSGLTDIIVKCSCSASRNMGGALGKLALRGVTKCFGSQPWIVNSTIADCEHLPRGVQRGASNVWQAVTSSAISIPPWSGEANRFVDRYWAALKGLSPEMLIDTVKAMLVDRPLPGLQEALGAIENRRRIVNGEPMRLETMRSQEYQALCRETLENHFDSDFTCRRAEAGESIPEGISLLNVVSRLREVRALRSFYRLTSGQGGEVIESPLSGTRKWWLPAIEVSGEGLFIVLDKKKLGDWENNPKVISRAEKLKVDQGENPLLKEIPVATPRFILAHTLAHVLIDQWSLACGYPSASLRERIYVDDEMCGLLIYTATSDSQGSLGGLVGMAKDGRFMQSFEEAILRASWCSNDPLCIESGPNGYESLNLASCHSCALLPETCCEVRNVLLDRGALIGAPDGTPGFFDYLLEL